MHLDERSRGPTDMRSKGHDRQFATLVSLFERQLTEGCGDDSCTQAPCCTYRSHDRADKPARRPTSTSARATAFYLATLPNPHTLLCKGLKHPGQPGRVSPAPNADLNKKDATSFTQTIFETLGAPKYSHSSSNDGASFPADHLQIGFATHLDLAKVEDPSRRIPFLRASLFTRFEDPFELLKCFSSISDSNSSMPLIPLSLQLSKDNTSSLQLDTIHVDTCMRYLLQTAGPDAVFSSLYRGLEGMMSDVGGLLLPQFWRGAESRPTAQNISTTQITHGLVICIHALAAYVDMHEGPTQNASRSTASELARLNCRPALKLTGSLCKVLNFDIGSIDSNSRHQHSSFVDGSLRLKVKEYLLRTQLGEPVAGRLLETSMVVAAAMTADYCHYFTWSVFRGFIYWIVNLFRQSWDGKFVMPKHSLPATILGVLDYLLCSDQFNLVPRESVLSLVGRAFLTDTRGWDAAEIAKGWIQRDARSEVTFLDFDWIFWHDDIASPLLTRCFRFICLTRMTKSIHEAETYLTLIRKSLGWKRNDRDIGRVPEMETLVMGTTTSNDHASASDGGARRATNRCLDIIVRRHSLLNDALDQLWRREKRELLRPIKVKIEYEGEDGMDQGGVAQEFFRLAVAEALNPSYDLFKIDERTRTAWFNPESVESLQKYELLGILFGLALYNGFTLPVTFPRAFYHLLLDTFEPKLDMISDFEVIHRSFQWLLSYEGDVEEDIGTSYIFSFNAHGQNIEIDMTTQDPETWSLKDRLDSATDLQVDAPAITSQNRKQFVKDYINWMLIHSVAPQFSAFVAGFTSIVEKPLLKTLDVPTFKALLEGQQDINVDDLERQARYMDFSPNEPIIRDFWSIIREYPLERRKLLLEFVTASDRLPPNGVADLEFVIQRNGGDNERIPTSMTCFGRLLLPAYATKQKLEDKLRVALDNAAGFGNR